MKSESEVAQSCPTLSDPMDCSLSGFSVHGIFQARVLEWVATAFSARCVYVLLKAYSLQFLLPSTSCAPCNKILKGKQTNKNTFEETENASERDTAGMLELSDWEFETTMINMLRALMDKVDSMQKQTGNVSRDGNPKENQEEMVDIKNFVTEMKNAFDGLTSRLDTAEESVSLRI